MRYQWNLIGTVVVTLAGFALASWGWITSGGLKWDRPDEGAAIIAGGIVFFLSGLYLLSILSNYRRARRVKSNPLGKFHVSASAIATFFEFDRKADDPNHWRPTQSERRTGVEVSWAGDTLLVGGCFWGVAQENYPKVTAVELRLRPLPHVVIRYNQLWIDSMKSRDQIYNTHRSFRFPVTDETAARAMVKHLNEMLDRGPTRQTYRNFRRIRIIFGTLAGLFILGGASIFGYILYQQSAGEVLSVGQQALAISAAIFAIIGGPMCLIMVWAVRNK